MRSQLYVSKAFLTHLAIARFMLLIDAHEQSKSRRHQAPSAQHQELKEYAKTTKYEANCSRHKEVMALGYHVQYLTHPVKLKPSNNKLTQINHTNTPLYLRTAKAFISRWDFISIVPHRRCMAEHLATGLQDNRRDALRSPEQSQTKDKMAANKNRLTAAPQHKEDESPEKNQRVPFTGDHHVKRSALPDSPSCQTMKFRPLVWNSIPTFIFFSLFFVVVFLFFKLKPLAKNSILHCGDSFVSDAATKASRKPTQLSPRQRGSWDGP